MPIRRRFLAPTNRMNIYSSGIIPNQQPHLRKEQTAITWGVSNGQVPHRTKRAKRPLSDRDSCWHFLEPI